MNIRPFELERYFAKYEFSAPYMLSSSDCEPLTLKEILTFADKESLKLWENLWLGYTESQGHPLLREEIVRLYSGVSPNQIITVVPEEGILIAMNVLLERGDHVISTYPGYQTLYGIAETLGCEVTKWLPEIKDNKWKFDVEFIRKSIKRDTKLIVVNFPHNPTGALLSQDEFKEVLELAKENNIYLFSDEMYRLLEYGNFARLPSACEIYDNSISLFGLSKTFGLAGLRLGWLVTKNKELLNRFQTYKDYTTICGSAPSEILGLIALKSNEKIISRNLSIIKSNLKLLDELFTRYSEMFNWYKPVAGSIAFPELRISGLDVYDFCQNLVKEKGVMLLPSRVYDYRGNNFRIGFGRKNMSEALNLLEEYLSEKYT